MAKNHPTKVPKCVYVKAKLVSVMHGVRLFTIATEASKEYIHDVQAGLINPAEQAATFDVTFKDEPAHTWNVHMDEDVRRELRHLSIDYSIDLYKALTFAVNRYVDKHYPET